MIIVMPGHSSHTNIVSKWYTHIINLKSFLTRDCSPVGSALWWWPTERYINKKDRITKMWSNRTLIQKATWPIFKQDDPISLRKWVFSCYRLNPSVFVCALSVSVSAGHMQCNTNIFNLNFPKQRKNNNKKNIFYTHIKINQSQTWIHLIYTINSYIK